MVVVAPDREQSACGHSLTLNRPLRIDEVRPGQFAVDGTPTDCVNLAVHWMLRDQPVDLVVSGINNGLNLGDDVTYSGTVSAALEAHLLGLPAIAFSQQIDGESSFPRSAKVAATLVRGLLEHGLPGARAAQRQPAGAGAERCALHPAGAARLRAGGLGARRPARAALLLDRRRAALGGGARLRPCRGDRRPGVDHAAAPRPHRLPGARGAVRSRRPRSSRALESIG